MKFTQAMIAEVTPDGMTRQEAREADPTLMAGLSLSDVLSENCCLADIDLSWNKVGDKGARSLLRVVSAQNIITRLRLVGNQVLVADLRTSIYSRHDTQKGRRHIPLPGPACSKTG